MMAPQQLYPDEYGPTPESRDINEDKEPASEERLRDPTTTQVQSLRHVQPKPGMVPQSSIPERSMAFYFPRSEDTIFVEMREGILLGRTANEADSRILDLSPYGATDLGVSRNHAVVVLLDSTCVIRDLNSTNGTYINGKRIKSHQEYNLWPGDHVQLGKFEMHIYFRTVRQQPGATVIALKYRPHPNQPSQEDMLTSNLLATVVVPFLEGVSQIQQILSQTQGLDPAPVVIEAITASPLTITLSGAQNAIELLTGKLIPWEVAHLDLVNNAYGVEITTEESADTGFRNLLSGLINRSASEEPEAPDTRLNKAIYTLALDVAAGIDPSLANEDLRNFADKLQPHLANIVLSGVILSR